MKVGDKVVCIDDDNLSYPDEITIGMTYSVINYTDYNEKSKDNLVYIINDSGRDFGYYEFRFVSLKEGRRLKINNINKRYGKK